MCSGSGHLRLRRPRYLAALAVVSWLLWGEWPGSSSAVNCAPGLHHPGQGLRVILSPRCYEKASHGKLTYWRVKIPSKKRCLKSDPKKLTFPARQRTLFGSPRNGPFLEEQVGLRTVDSNRACGELPASI